MLYDADGNEILSKGAGRLQGMTALMLEAYKASIEKLAEELLFQPAILYGPDGELLFHEIAWDGTGGFCAVPFSREE